MISGIDFNEKTHSIHVVVKKGETGKLAVVPTVRENVRRCLPRNCSYSIDIPHKYSCTLKVRVKVFPHEKWAVLASPGSLNVLVYGVQIGYTYL